MKHVTDMEYESQFVCARFEESQEGIRLRVLFFWFFMFFFLKFLNFTGNISNYLQEVYCIEWSPTGPTTDNPNLTLLLAR